MILTEYDEQKVRNAFYEDGRLEGIDVGRLEGIDVGRLEGIDVGFEQGLEKKSLEAARNLKKKGIPDEVIAECVGLPLEVVQKL